MKTCHADKHPPSTVNRTMIPVVPSQQLFGSAREVIINHLGVEYRLRRTRNGKLLLNK